MAKILSRLAQFCTGERGEMKVEYVIALALIVVFCIWGIQYLGSATNTQNNSTSNMLQSAATPSSS